MKISLTNEALKQIYKVCSPHTAKNDIRPLFTYIQLSVEDGVCTATALNNTSLAQTKITVEGEDGEYLIPVVKVPKGSFCTIENTDKEIVFDFLTDKLVFCKPKGDFPDWKRIIPNRESTYEIGFSPAVMTSAMTSFKGESVVKMSYGSPLEGLIVTSDNARVLALPTRLKEGK